MPANPILSDLLDPKVRKQLRMYATFGYIGFVIGEALAYIELIEEELARRDRERPEETPS